MEALFILVFIGVIVLAVLQWQAKQKRRAAIHQWALANNLAYSADDTVGIPLRFDFTLLGRGEGRGCENVITGQWQGMSVILADYWYYTESTDSEGRRSRSYSRFSIVIAQIAAWLPPLRVERENVLTRLADHVGLRDIDFESEDFNRRFNVRCDDREFAFKLIDPRMMEWLLAASGDVCVEVSGAHVLVWRKPVPAEELPALLHAAQGFVENVPRLVWAEYGKAAS